MSIITGLLQDVKLIAAGSNQVLKVSLGDLEIVYELDEAGLVIARMTNPSTAFQEAITEYVIAEQAALNDNWDLTYEVWFFNADQYINSIVGWKIANIISGDVSGLYAPNDGYINGGGATDTLQWDFIYGTVATNPADARISINVKGFSPTVSTQAVAGLFDTSGTFMNRLDAVTLQPVVHSVAGTPTTLTPELIAVFQGVLNNNTAQLDTYLNQTLIGSNGGSPVAPSSNPATLSVAFTGTHRGMQISKSIGFDPIANQANQIRFNYRMMVQKYAANVTPVLARFSNLRANEVTAISIFVAQMTEMGLWNNLDDIMYLNLQDPGDAMVGLKGIMNGAFVNGAGHIPGLGVITANNSAEYVDTGFIPVSMGNVSSTDAIYGGILDVTDPASTVHWAGGANTFFRRKSNGRPRAAMHGVISPDAGNAFTFTKYDYIAESNPGGSGFDLYLNDLLAVSDGAALGSPDSVPYRINNSNINAAIGGISGTAYIGTATGFDRANFRFAQYYCYNGIKLGIAPSTDWNVANQTYDWGNQELAVIHSTDLLTIIVGLSTVVTGRTLNLTGSLGFSLKTQADISILVGQGWNVIT